MKTYKDYLAENIEDYLIGKTIKIVDSTELARIAIKVQEEWAILEAERQWELERANAN